MEILEVILKLILAIALGGLIGLEREASQKPAGFRTNVLVCVASAMMMTLAMLIVGAKGGTPDTLVRMAVGVITGVGFLGAGTILQARGTIAGLTTATTLWLVAGLGLVIGAGYYLPALIITALTITTLLLFRRIEDTYLRRSQFHYHLKAKARPYILASPRKLALHHGVRLERLTMKQEGASYLMAFAFSASEEKEQEFNQGLLELAVGYNARNDDRLHTTQLQVGILGPAAMGEQAQNGVHGMLGDDKFRGWDNQLENEPVFRIVHERMRRFAPEANAEGWGWDAISHYGGSVGNLTTYANVGGEIRFGRNLPVDFGSTPLRPAGENTAPLTESHRFMPGAHLFVHLDARWVVHDIALDGNTFRDSHSVDKNIFVADFMAGAAVFLGRTRLAYTHVLRTKEYKGQKVMDQYGALTFSVGF